jgi:uncharacterized membrane protein
MTELVLAALFLPLSHFGISSSSLRGRLVSVVGERPYLGIYSLVTLAAFGWLIIAYRHSPLAVTWVAPAFVKLAALIVVLVGFLLVVVGVTTPNPTAVGADALFERPDAVRGIVRVTGILFFGSVGSLGLIGAHLLDAKKARQHGARWERFATQTSSVPFLAIAQGRQRLAIGEMGLWRVLLALALFAIFLTAHAKLFGVSPFPS